MGHPATQRVVLMSGRYELSATREDRWQLAVFSDAADVAIPGPAVEMGAWVHLVAAYDGTMARLWVNAEEVTWRLAAASAAAATATTAAASFAGSLFNVKF